MKKFTQALAVTAALLSSLTVSHTLIANSTAAKSSPTTVMRDYFSHLESGNIEALMALLDDQVIWHQPGNNVLSGTYVGKEAVGQLFANFMQISGGTFKIDSVTSIMENGQMVAANLHFSAERCRYVSYTMSMDGVDLMRIEDGKIKEVFLFSSDQEKEDEFWGKI